MSPDPPKNHQRTAARRSGGRDRGIVDRLASCSPLWPLTTHQRRRLAPAVVGASSADWTPAALAEVAGANTAGIRNPAAVLAARLSPGELPPPKPNAARRPSWCGECGKATRMLGYRRDAPRPCPRCKGPSQTGDRSARGTHDRTTANRQT
jgi:hypothetical protein